MKKICLVTILLFSVLAHCCSQDKTDTVTFNGFYIANSGKTGDASHDTYTYLRFYKNGTIYSQAVSSNDPKAVSRWFGRYKTFSQKGKYQVTGNIISIQLSNKESKDFQLEGLQETTYNGTITPQNTICLKRDKESTEHCFNFSGVSDTTRLKYAEFKPEIKLPGEWKIKQILKSNGQVFFTNDDSTIIAIAIFKAAKLPVYKETQSDFETAHAYYEWDSKYMNEEQHMEVRKIGENKEKAFVIWNAKDESNDNYHLFARHKDLLFNIMVYDPAMTVQKQLQVLEVLYDLNKD